MFWKEHSRMINQIKERVENIDYTISHNKKTAIIVIAFNRPDYFSKVLDSISKNKEAEELPVFFYLDGGPFATIKENIEIIKSYENIKNKFLICRDGNVGCSKNIIDARRFVFDKLDFELAFVFEDDLVISDNYIRLLLNTYDGLSKKYDNIGMIQGWNLDSEANEEEPTMEKLSSFEAVGATHLWGYLMPRKAWDGIKENMYKYEEIFHDPLPKNGMGKQAFESDLPTVRKFMRSCWEDFDFDSAPENILKDPFIKSKRKRIHSLNVATGQDAMTESNLASKGFVRLMSSQNRAKYIGRRGLHATEQTWAKWGFDQITLRNHPEDRVIEDFDIVGGPTWKK
jgi:hypothetical protein